MAPKTAETEVHQQPPPAVEAPVPSDQSDFSSVTAVLKGETERLKAFLASMGGSQEELEAKDREIAQERARVKLLLQENQRLEAQVQQLMVLKERGASVADEIPPEWLEEKFLLLRTTQELTEQVEELKRDLTKAKLEAQSWKEVMESYVNDADVSVGRDERGDYEDHEVPVAIESHEIQETPDIQQEEVPESVVVVSQEPNSFAESAPQSQHSKETNPFAESVPRSQEKGHNERTEMSENDLKSVEHAPQSIEADDHPESPHEEVDTPVFFHGDDAPPVFFHTESKEFEAELDDTPAVFIHTGFELEATSPNPAPTNPFAESSPHGGNE